MIKVNINVRKYSLIYISFVRYLILLIFSYAFMVKLLNYKEFLVQLSESPIIPSSLTFFFSIFLLFIEFVVCVLTVTKLYRLGLLFSYSLMVFFTIYIYYLLHFSPYLPCACGGILGNIPYTIHLIFNLAITILIFLAILFDESLNFYL